MKSLLASAKLLTVSFGNLIVVIVSEVKFFENHVRQNNYHLVLIYHICFKLIYFFV